MKHFLLQLIFSAVILLIANNAVKAQTDDYTKYQDTLFIRHSLPAFDSLIYTTDSIVFRSQMANHYLVGTTILPNTNNRMMAMHYGMYLNGVRITACEGEAEAYGDDAFNKVEAVRTTDTSMVIDLKIFDNCCFDFLCDAIVDSTGTLDLLFTGYGTYCSCDCCFGLTYLFEIRFDEDTPPIKQVMINGDRSTLFQLKQ